MYIFLIIVHIIVCMVLILVVLLQAGRGGGMSDMMGGGQPSTLFGTQTNAFMTRATEVCAVLFIVTSLSLGILSTQRGKSVMERRRFADAIKKSLPGMPETTGIKTTPAAAVPVLPVSTPGAVPVDAAAPVVPAPTTVTVAAPAAAPAAAAAPVEPSKK